jgi:DNA polymerase-4
MIDKLEKIADELERRMKKSDTKGKTITLKIKYSDFTQQTRSKTTTNFMQNKADFFPVVKELLYQDEMVNSVRLLGLSFGNLNTDIKESVWVQLKLKFDDY